MTFKLDENLPEQAARLLRKHSFDAHTVHDEDLRGATDEVIAEVARREGRILVTLDRDFCNIRAYPPSEYMGIIVLRPADQDLRTILALLQRLIVRLAEDVPVKELWIVEQDRIRRRS